MEKPEIFRHAFEAFSALSDAQDSLHALSSWSQIDEGKRAVAHAKAHLDALLHSDRDLLAEAIGHSLGPCSLKGG